MNCFTRNFNPHSPYGEWLIQTNKWYLSIKFQSTLSVWRVTNCWKGFFHRRKFQSTLSVWRVTCFPMSETTSAGNFNPHSPYGEWLDQKYVINQLEAISIHTLRMESDVNGFACKRPCVYFNPHSPYGEWRLVKHFFRFHHSISIHTLRMESDKSNSINKYINVISIHTLRMESDWYSEHYWAYRQYFNPHSPYGEWLTPI